MTSELTASRICVLLGIMFGVVAVAVKLTLAGCSLDQITSFFSEHLREPLFIGLLTAATFLFSLKTFILVTMEQNVYSKDWYKKDWLVKRELNKSLRRYAPLQNFSVLLFLSILVTMVSAVLQFTLGLWEVPGAALICLATACWSIAMIFVSLFFLQKNLLDWFKYLDDSSNEGTL